jgi:hypothetical protein
VMAKQTDRDTGDEEFSALEREALAAWRAVEPPAGFCERVISEASRQRGAVSPFRGMAVAALAAALLAGLFSVRALMGHGTGSAAPGDRDRAGVPFPAGLSSQDAGPRPEVRVPFDGLEAQPS